MEKNVIGIGVSVKAANDEQRYIEGIATTPTVDRSGDIVEPLGATFEREIPLYLEHNSSLRVGRVQLGKPTKDGIPFKAWMPKVIEDGPLRQRVDTAWQELKYGLLKHVSIGFRILDNAYELIKETRGIRFLKTEILELSLVPVPAQPDARISFFKSFSYSGDDVSHATETRLRLAASGRSASAPQSAGASASQLKGNGMKTMQEQVAELRDTLATKRARMKEIDEVVTKDGLTDEATAEISELRKEIGELSTMVAMKEGQIADSETAVAPATKAASTRGPSILVKKADPDEKFQGQAYTRKILAKALAFLESKDAGFAVRPSEVAARLWGKSHPQLVSVLKANEVAGGGTGSGEWGAELVAVDGRYMGDFITYLYSKTVFDRLPLREVPARVTIKGQDGVATGYWVGESKAIKVSTGDFSSVNTTPYKVGAITQFSKELLEDSSPAVEMLMRDALEEALRQRIDSTFLSTSNVSAGVSPAGILYNLSIGASNGPDAQSARTDYRTLIANFITAKNLDGLYWVTTPTLGVGLGSMVNALGQPEFPSVNASGGTYMGYPMITGDNVGSGDFILLKPSDIWKIGDMGIQVQVSDTAMLESSSAPSGAADVPTAADQALTSMFQTDSVAIKVTRRISFGLRRSTAVAYIGDAAYGAEAS